MPSGFQATDHSPRRSLEAAAGVVADAGVCGVLFVAPLVFGGRHELGAFLYAACVALAAGGAAAEQAARTWSKCPRRAPAGAPPPKSILAIGLMALGLMLLQVTPLSEPLRGWLAGAPESLLPLWFDGGPLGAWRTISMTPAETLSAAAVFATHLCWFLVVWGRLSDRRRLERLLVAIAIATAGMAALGLANHAAPNGKLLWVYPHAQRDFGADVQGAFANRNHFAHFLVLGLGPLAWLALRPARWIRGGPGHAPRRERTPIVAGLALVLVVVACLASRSRGGLVALAVATIVAAALQLRAGALRGGQVVLLSVAALAVAGGVSLVGYDRVTERLDDLLAGDLDALDAEDARRLLWGANADALAARPVAGFGAGAHREVYPLFLEQSFPREFTHAESGYLQVASETGAVGLALLAAAMLAVGWWIVGAARRESAESAGGLLAAVAPGLVASATHAVFDFVWYIPSLLATTLALAACTGRLASWSREPTSAPVEPVASPLRRVPLGAAAVACLAVVAGAMLYRPAAGSLDWDRYLRLSAALHELSKTAVDRPGKAIDPKLPATMRYNTALATEALRRVVRNDPQNARAHLRLAGRLLQRFELETVDSPNAMAVELVRDAALASHFASPQATEEWLRRAFGESADLLVEAHEHAKCAVRLCPLAGEGYLYLASLAMLDTPPIAPMDLVAQALAVRPHDGEVLFEAGRQEHLAGRHDDAMAHWRDCIARHGSHRQKLVALVAGVAPASEFVADMRPDVAVLSAAIAQYRLRGTPEDVAALAEYAVAGATQPGLRETPRVVAERWRQASELLGSIGRHDEAVDAARRGYALAPHQFYVRLQLAIALHDSGRAAEADPHVRWCLSRRPDYTFLQQWLVEAARQRARESQLARSPATRVASSPPEETRR